MSPDEFRPNPPMPERRRELRFEVTTHRNGAETVTTLVVEDPQSHFEVESFFAIAGAVLDPEPPPMIDEATWARTVGLG